MADGTAPAAIHARDRGKLPEPCWTVAEAVEFFAKDGLPMRGKDLARQAERLRLIIRGLEWQPAGYREVPDRPQGGRRPPVYPVAELMRLHSGVARWLVRAPE